MYYRDEWSNPVLDSSCVDDLSSFLVEGQAELIRQQTHIEMIYLRQFNLTILRFQNRYALLIRSDQES
jgi:hypothetical protein